MESPNLILDEFDKNIIRKMFLDARISLKKLGEEMGTNHTNMYNHLKKLIDTKVIKKFTIEVDPKYVNQDFIFILKIIIIKSNNYELDKISAKAFAAYLIKNFQDKIVFLSITKDCNIFIITQFNSNESSILFLNDLKAANHFVERVEIIESENVLIGTKLLSINI